MPIRETLRYDVVIVGAGAAGLAAAWRLRSRNRGLAVCVLEKAARVGGHLLSGALLDPADLDPLMPDWRQQGAPLQAPVATETLSFLTASRAWPLPVPRSWRHTGCHMISLGPLCRWLAQRAEGIGVEIFPGFAAVEGVWHGETLVGVATGDSGRRRDGTLKPGFQLGVEIRAPLTILAEGCRGSLTRLVTVKKRLGAGRSPQTYALGFKELWSTPGSPSGQVWHTLGWPLRRGIHGAGFLYRPEEGQTALGFVAGLDYQDPYFDPFVAFQTWKSHPVVRALLARGRPLAYGARTVAVGGWQSLPRLVWDGGLLAGDSGGFFNAATLQGIGNAVGSGILAADAVLAAFGRGDFSAHGLRGYEASVRASSWGRRLYRARNVRPGFRRGLWPGLLNAAWQALTRGGLSRTLTWEQRDRERLQSAAAYAPQRPFFPDGVVTHAPMDALSRSGVQHEEDQPSHIQLTDPNRTWTEGRLRYAAPETRYCPARVFECRTRADGVVDYQIHPSNCLHCKCCDLKDPMDNMRWTPPEGGGGPDYRDL